MNDYGVNVIIILLCSMGVPIFVGNLNAFSFDLDSKNILDKGRGVLSIAINAMALVVLLSVSLKLFFEMRLELDNFISNSWLKLFIPFFLFSSLILPIFRLQRKINVKIMAVKESKVFGFNIKNMLVILIISIPESILLIISGILMLIII